jgi:phenylalanyl-tRNA synthetase beta chain
MKISLNTIRGLNRRYGCADDVAKIGIDELVEKIGAQLGSIEEVIEFGKKYTGIVIARVVSCQKHPDADKLQVCTIDDGGITPDVKRDDNGHVQVVCGAPNVRAGLSVAWLPPGTTVPDTVGKEPFTLEAREIRGQTSNGMLASPKELGLGDDHDGILEIDGDLAPGTDFAAAFDLKDDIVLDIENKMFTHRPDCFGFLGVARELAGIQGMPYKSPDWYTPNPKFPDVEAEELKLEVKNELPEIVPRFTAITMRDVQVGPSPVWLRVELAKLGQKSINNIVDYTNFFMLETGQPLHAYDYDKVKALSAGDNPAIVIRNPKPGEKIKLLNGKEIEPRAEAIMIATDKQLIGVGGVMGGADTEVDNNTKNIILECANFDMYSIRRTSMAHGLFTDAVTRFNKGQSPLQNLAVLNKIVDEIQTHAGGKVAATVIDDKHLQNRAFPSETTVHAPIMIAPDFINARLGLSLSEDEMILLLTNVEFDVLKVTKELEIQAPFWRTDIELREDVVEEIGRLYGYDKLPLELPKRDLTPTVKDPLLTLKARVRQTLSAKGANEVLTYSFVPGNLLEKVGQDPSKAFEISNALSPDLQYYRISLLPSLLEKVHPNIKAGYDEFALFELGKTHSLDHKEDDDGLPKEFEFTALVVAAADKLKKTGSSYYQARKYLTELAGAPLEFKPVGQDMQQYPVVQPYAPNRSALVSDKSTGEFLGIIGEFKLDVTRNLKLPKYCAGFEVDTTALQAIFKNAKKYVSLPRFPKVTQDITLKVPADLSYQELFDFVSTELDKAQPENTLPGLGPIDIYRAPDDTKHKNITLRLNIASYERTLTDTEVNKLLDAIAAAAKNKYAAERI